MVNNIGTSCHTSVFISSEYVINPISSIIDFRVSLTLSYSQLVFACMGHNEKALEMYDLY